jgi:hypothetical protein
MYAHVKERYFFFSKSEIKILEGDSKNNMEWKEPLMLG